MEVCRRRRRNVRSRTRAWCRRVFPCARGHSRDEGTPEPVTPLDSCVTMLSHRILHGSPVPYSLTTKIGRPRDRGRPTQYGVTTQAASAVCRDEIPDQGVIRASSSLRRGLSACRRCGDDATPKPVPEDPCPSAHTLTVPERCWTRRSRSWRRVPACIHRSRR